MPDNDIPKGLRPHFQEYDVATLDLDCDANLIIGKRSRRRRAWPFTQSLNYPSSTNSTWPVVRVSLCASDIASLWIWISSAQAIAVGKRRLDNLWS